MKLKHFLFLLFFALIVSSCSGNDSKKDQYYTAQFFDSYLQTLCQSSTQCQGGLINQSNVSDCPELFRSINIPWEFFHKGEKIIFRQKVALLEDAEQRGLLSISKEKAEKCLEVVKESHPCNPLAVNLMDISECSNLFEGKKTVGDECYQNEECADGWCKMGKTQCPGHCVLYVHKNEDCNESKDKCEPGYVCRTSGCAKLTQGVVGDPCSSDEQCSNFLYCNKKSEDDAAGICYKKKGVGQHCDKNNECLIGLSCIKNQCSGSAITNTSGEVCGQTSGKICNYFSKLDCINGTCQSFPQTNENCSLFCETGTFCNQQTKRCEAYQGIGHKCSSNLDCDSQFCLNGVCALPECVQQY